MNSKVVLEKIYKMCFYNCFDKMVINSHKFNNRIIEQLNKKCITYDKKNVQNILKLENVIFNDIVKDSVDENKIINLYNVECRVNLDYLKEFKNVSHYHPINLDLLEIYKKNIKNSNDRAIVLSRYKKLRCEMKMDIEREINKL